MFDCRPWETMKSPLGERCVGFSWGYFCFPFAQLISFFVYLLFYSIPCKSTRKMWHRLLYYFISFLIIYILMFVSGAWLLPSQGRWRYMCFWGSVSHSLVSHSRDPSHSCRGAELQWYTWKASHSMDSKFPSSPSTTHSAMLWAPSVVSEIWEIIRLFIPCDLLRLLPKYYLLK